MHLNRLTKTIFTTCAAMMIGTSTAPIYAQDIKSGSSSEVALDSTAAIVNSDIVLQSELNRVQAEVERNFKARGASVSPINARRAALEQLITRSIVLQQGKQFGFQLTDTQINEALAHAATQSNTSIEQILASYGKVSEAQARQMFADEMIINEIRNNQVRRRVRISDAEVALLAKSLRNVGTIEPSYHLAQLVLPLNATASLAELDRVTALANKIKREARQGVDFNSLVAAYGQGSTASQGGDLGYVSESQVPIPFLPAILKAQEGDVLGPFRSPFGLHLIKLYDINTQAVEPITTYKAKHILLTTSIIFSDEAAKNQLETLRHAIVNGQISFADAAKKYSEDPGSASLGGELGYAPASRYDPAFAQGLVKLAQGQVSEPIKSSFGWHLILLEDKKVEKDSDEAYEQRARELIFRRLFAEEGQAWERELRASAFIRVTDPVLLQAGIDQSTDEAK